jgi:Heptaprenyl diphosphate synthase component I.
MYSLFFLTKRDALLLVLLKGLFVLATRGVTAGFLSFCGGVLSITVLLILLFLFKNKLSYLLLSISGAVFHNIGQYFAIYVIYRIWLVPYLPVLILSGIVAGFVTSVLLKTVLPVLQKLHLK